MKRRDWIWLWAALPIAAASNTRADFDPYEASRSAVTRHHLEERVDRASLQCDADLVHSGGFPAYFLASIDDKLVRETLANVCALIYAGQRATASAVAYGLLNTEAARTVARLEAAIEVILRFSREGD